MELSEEEWDRIAKWIRDNTCGCVWVNFNGESLRKELQVKGVRGK